MGVKTIYLSSPRLYSDNIWRMDARSFMGIHTNRRLNEKGYWFVAIFVCSLFVLLSCALLVSPDFGNAQIRVQNNNNKTQENNSEANEHNVEKAFAEAKKIQEDIVTIMASKKPNYKLLSQDAYHLKWGADRRDGTTINDIVWKKGKYQKFRVVIHLKLHKNGLSEQFWKRLNLISMGDFFKVEGIGDEAILVKNVYANTSMTNVGLHFIKGRANVQTYLRNYTETTANNEKELRELVSLIEPLIVARDNFDDE